MSRRDERLAAEILLGKIFNHDVVTPTITFHPDGTATRTTPPKLKGSSAHFIILDELADSTWPVREIRDFKRDAYWWQELYGQLPDPIQCDNRLEFDPEVRCQNAATLEVVTDGVPTGAVCCGPCSRMHRKLSYRKIQP